jgi:hypothetical protein
MLNPRPSPDPDAVANAEMLLLLTQSLQASFETAVSTRSDNSFFAAFANSCCTPVCCIADANYPCLIKF